MRQKKNKYEAPKEYRILYKHKGDVSEQYHYYSCYDSKEALETFQKIASNRGWDDLKIVHVEEFDKWHNTWKVLADMKDDPQQGFSPNMDFGTTME